MNGGKNESQQLQQQNKNDFARENVMLCFKPGA